MCDAALVTTAQHNLDAGYYKTINLRGLSTASLGPILCREDYANIRKKHIATAFSIRIPVSTEGDPWLGYSFDHVMAGAMLDASGEICAETVQWQHQVMRETYSTLTVVMDRVEGEETLGQIGVSAGRTDGNSSINTGIPIVADQEFRFIEADAITLIHALDNPEELPDERARWRQKAGGCVCRRALFGEGSHEDTIALVERYAAQGNTLAQLVLSKRQSHEHCRFMLYIAMGQEEEKMCGPGAGDVGLNFHCDFGVSTVVVRRDMFAAALGPALGPVQHGCSEQKARIARGDDDYRAPLNESTRKVLRQPPMHAVA